MPRAAGRGERVIQEEPARMAGVIVRIMADKGFFFIQVGGAGGVDYFGHKSALENSELTSLAVGDQVTFAPVSTNKGWRAEQIVVEGRS
jgi:cold shock CspA family protein